MEEPTKSAPSNDMQDTAKRTTGSRSPSNSPSHRAKADADHDPVSVRPLHELSGNVHRHDVHHTTIGRPGSSLRMRASGSVEGLQAGANSEDALGRRSQSVDGNAPSSNVPSVTITEPASGTRTTSKTFELKRKAAKAHFPQMFSSDQAASINSSLDNILELKHALNLSISQKDAERKNRMTRTLERGNAETLRKTGSSRVYFLAANLTTESEYAIQCAIGQVLRDGRLGIQRRVSSILHNLDILMTTFERLTMIHVGDSLVIMFAIDKDTKVSALKRAAKNKSPVDSPAGTPITNDEPTDSSKSSGFLGMRRLLPTTRRSSEEIEARSLKKARVRYQAVEQLTSKCIQLVRKTTLQVRIVLEVVHCKDAHRMLMEAIDILQPVLAIVGSRGRTMVQGKLLGSFSRELIADSSVPVMTARMKNSPNAPTSQPRIILENNLVPARGVLNNAKHSDRLLKQQNIEEGMALKQPMLGDDDGELESTEAENQDEG